MTVKRIKIVLRNIFLLNDIKYFFFHFLIIFFLFGKKLNFVNGIRSFSANIVSALLCTNMQYIYFLHQMGYDLRGLGASDNSQLVFERNFDFLVAIKTLSSFLSLIP